MPRGWIWTFGVAVVLLAIAYERFWGPQFMGTRTTEARRHQGNVHADAIGFGQLAARHLGGADCRLRAEEAWSEVERSNEEYRHPALQELHASLRRLGGAFPSLAECLLAEMGRVSPLGLRREALPMQRQFSRAGRRFSLAVTEPGEPWAAARGYAYKGFLSVDGKLALVAYWTGSGNLSRGFLIQGPALDEGSPRGAGYVLWDRLATPQTVKVWAAEIGTEYLHDTMPTALSARADHALYGELVFDAATSRLALWNVSVEPQRGRLRASGKFGCFRLRATGRLGDKIKLGHTYAALGEMGHDADSSAKDASEMDWVELTDSRKTDEDEETLVSEETGVSFPKSCHDLFSAGKPGGPFGAGADVVDFFTSPTEIFGE